MNSEDARMLVIVAGIVALAFIVIKDIKVPQTITTSAKTVQEVRAIAQRCIDKPNHHLDIITIYNAPVGQPRKPVEWLLTCTRASDKALNGF